MKVAIIGTTAQTVLAFRSELIKDLIQNGHKVYMLALDYDKSAKDQIRDLGAEPVDYIFSRSGLNPFADLYNTFKLRNILKKIGPEVVFSYFAKPIVFGTLAAYLSGVRQRIGMFEGLGYAFTDMKEGLSFKKKILKKIQIFLYKMSLPLLSQLIFLNKDDYNDLIKKNKINIKNHLILGGIGLNLDQYKYSLPVKNPITFLFIGRLLAEKGIYEFINAAKIVKSKFSDVRFVVLGGLDLANPSALTQIELNQLISQGIVISPGFVDNVTAYIESSSVFVLPSYREGFPRSTQEAMAAGRAIITTDVPGCRDTVVEGKNGFLIRPWNHEDLANKMIYFIQNPDEIEKMGVESYNIAKEKFNSHNVNLKLLEYLKL